MRNPIVLASLFAFASLALGAAPNDAPGGAAPDADAIFARAKTAWRTRTDAPFVAYSLLERYTWRARVHDNWWRVAFRTADRRLALARIVVPEQEAARMRGTAIGVNVRWHMHGAHADSLDTNPDADAFPVLDPLVDPDASFGLVRRESAPSLARTVARATPLPEISPEAVASPEVTESPDSADAPLREIARVEAVARDYRITLVGVERVRDADAYHLALAPLRDPKLYRLRDLWIATADYATLRLDVDGLFSGRPYADARWTVDYTTIDGRTYVQQIKTTQTLRFGLDRYVAGLEYDFVSYEFPPTLPDYEFDRLL